MDALSSMGLIYQKSVYMTCVQGLYVVWLWLNDVLADIFHQTFIPQVNNPASRVANFLRMLRCSRARSETT